MKKKNIHKFETISNKQIIVINLYVPIYSITFLLKTSNHYVLKSCMYILYIIKVCIFYK